MKTKKSKTLCSMLLSMLLVASMVPYTESTASADTVSNYSLNGNSGATVTLSSNVTSATINDSSLADVETDGKTVTVTGKNGAVGVAGITVNGSETFEVPIGYTTFIFNGDNLTVYEGSDDKYEVYGITADSEDEQDLSSTTDADGNTVYTNGEAKINVDIKKKGGSYVFAGTGSDMSIAVKKEASADANIMLAGLDLTSSMTAPITVKKNSTASVTINALEGTTNTLTDNAFNNADTYGDTEDGGDGTNAEYAESAVIKCKANSNVTLTGEGTLNLNCSTKNAIKSGESASLTIENLDLNVVSAKNGISADNTLTINSGDLDVTANDGDAIRSNPDTVDEDAGTAGNININGGNITLKASSDGIQAAQDVTITNGTFNITTGSGYNDSSFNKNTMSCKGIKASGSDDDTEDATNTITILGGNFTLNTADDAVHSDGYVVVTGGQFDINTGDDGIHADTSLTLGEENGNYGDVVVNVNNSYEGLESGNVYIYSGTYNVAASDDGINGAGGDGSNDNFNPGGGPGGRNNQGNRGNNDNPGMPSGEWNPGNGGNGGNGSSDYSVNIYGGNVYVNCEGDGLDSNGNLNLEGGNLTVWSQEAGRDNCPLDCDGTLYINGATVFAAGSNSMNEIRPSSDSQNYVTSTTEFAKGTAINVTDGSSVVYSTTAPKKVNFTLYSSPSMSSSCKISSSSTSSAETYTVLFNVNGHGTAPTSQTVNLGGFVTKPTDPTADGYTFNGWYTDSACTSAYKFSSAVNSNLTLYALWTANDVKAPTTGTYKLGDVDFNGSINSADALFVLRSSVGLETPNDTQTKFADVDGDGSITSADSLHILRYSVSLPTDSKTGEETEI